MKKLRLKNVYVLFTKAKFSGIFNKFDMKIFQIALVVSKLS